MAPTEKAALDVALCSLKICGWGYHEFSWLDSLLSSLQLVLQHNSLFLLSICARRMFQPLFSQNKSKYTASVPLHWPPWAPPVFSHFLAKLWVFATYWAYRWTVKKCILLQECYERLLAFLLCFWSFFHRENSLPRECILTDMNSSCCSS